jgi:hypothetical protein
MPAPVKPTMSAPVFLRNRRRVNPADRSAATASAV